MWQAIAGPVIELATGWIKRGQQIKQAETKGRIAYLATEQGHRHAWEIHSIQASGRGMRWASFVMWSGPVVYAFIAPVAASKAINQTFAALPDWYVYGYLLVTGGVWGLKEFATIRNTVKARRTGGT